MLTFRSLPIPPDPVPRSTHRSRMTLTIRALQAVDTNDPPVSGSLSQSHALDRPARTRSQTVSDAGSPNDSAPPAVLTPIEPAEPPPLFDTYVCPRAKANQMPCCNVHEPDKITGLCQLCTERDGHGCNCPCEACEDTTHTDEDVEGAKRLSEEADELALLEFTAALAKYGRPWPKVNLLDL